MGPLFDLMAWKSGPTVEAVVGRGGRPGAVRPTAVRQGVAGRGASMAGGAEAIVAGRAAAYLLGITRDEPPVVEVQVPHRRTPAPRPGMTFRRVRRIRESVPFDGVRITTGTETVLDLVAVSTRPGEAVRWIDAGCRVAVTTPTLLVAGSGQRRRLRRRALLLGV